MPQHAGPPALGIYTKTAVRSPAVQWILHAHVRHPRLNDVVLVGEDFVHIKEVDDSGHLRHVAIKTDFDARICAAATFTDRHKTQSPDDILRWDYDGIDLSEPPPQSIVLSLDSSDLVFLRLRADANGVLRFEQQLYPVPTLQRTERLGRHLAVDPISRAVAVAGPDGGVLIFPRRASQPITIVPAGRDWDPVQTPRLFRTDGVTQLMDFLIPPVNDPDLTVLILIVKMRNRNRVIRIDWQTPQDLQYATTHPPLSMDASMRSPNMLIPFRDAAFFVVTGDIIVICSNILSGCLEQIRFDGIMPTNSTRPGASRRSPVYTGWARPHRSPAKRLREDNFYIVREDGHLFYLEVVSPNAIETSYAGDLGCQVDRAFASLGDRETTLDFLITAGDMTAGVVVSIGSLNRRLHNVTRQTALKPCITETLPNWASVTDMLGGDIVQSRRHRMNESDNLLHPNSVYVTSGTQDHGAITELRHGLEAQLKQSFERDYVHMVNDAWALPNTDGSILLLLSSELGTIVAKISDLETFSDTEIPESFFDVESSTLSAGLSPSRQVVQVTRHAIRVSANIEENWEDTEINPFDLATSVIAATMTSQPFSVITSESRQDSWFINRYLLPNVDDNVGFSLANSLELTSKALCLAAMDVNGTDIVVLATTNDAKIMLLRFNQDGTTTKLASQVIPPSASEEIPCDQVALLRKAGPADGDPPRLLAVLGLRDGRLVTYEIGLERSDGPVHSERIIDFAHSTPKIVRFDSNLASAAVMSGEKTALLTWDGPDSMSVTIHDIWITDRARPEFSQGSILACAEFPSADQLNNELKPEYGTLIMLSAPCLQFVTLSRARSTIPRQMAVKGRPNRLIYAETLSCFVGVSKCFRVIDPSSSGEERRQVYYTLDFIPKKTGRSALTYEFQPGESIHSLLEWPYQNAEGKKYTQILVGGSYLSGTSGTTRGRVTFLQVHLDRKSGQDNKVLVTKNKKFDREVWALALHDPVTYVACAGDEVFVYRMFLEGSENVWKQICVPFPLYSHGLFLTVNDGDNDDRGRSIVITTAQDSLVVLTLEGDSYDGMSESCRLVELGTGPQAERGLSHYVLPSDAISGIETNGVVLMTTRYGTLVGLTKPTATSSAEVVFEAEFGPRSLTRIIAQPSARERPGGILSPKMLGCSTDGTLTSLALIDEPLRRRLFWLQRLCELSAELSPISQRRPRYRVDTSEPNGFRDQAVPIGLATGGHDATYEGARGNVVMVHTNESRPQEMHIDGDVLARVLEHRGVPAIQDVIRELSASGTGAGDWIRDRIDQEMAAVEDLVEVVRALDKWLAV